ncbi:MAG: hypothetical protein K8F25_03920, partial [Fimbriimonadaceae bacterium]|nr:hypothetical protein [Alphaproteobacteria bacterium]
MEQSIDLCLESAIGSAGITASEFERELERCKPALKRLQDATKKKSLPHLALPARRDDLKEIENVARRISETAGDVLICGTGGSSLGGQALAQTAGWHVPNGSECGSAKNRPRLHFLDNIDSFGFDRLLSLLDLGQTHVLLISKSGSTAETLAQGIALLGAFEKSGRQIAIPRHFTGLTEPAGKNGNGLRNLCEKYNIPVINHLSDLGGRFAALSNVGLLPARLAGLDISAVRDGAQACLQQALDGDGDASMPAIGAALSVAFLRQRSININVMLGYGDRLERFTKWHGQLWAESLGKDGQGMTPLPVQGPVDQHSQLQLFLDGPADKLYTIIMSKSDGHGARLSAELAGLAGADYLGGRHLGDLVDTMQRATVETLARRGRPVRTLRIDSVDAETMGHLMM